MTDTCRLFATEPTQLKSIQEEMEAALRQCRARAAEEVVNHDPQRTIATIRYPS